jgi:hypothetical protein
VVLLERLQPHQRQRPPGPIQLPAATDGSGDRYAQVALAEELARVAAAPVGQRNRQLGVRVAVHGSRQNDRDPVIWQPGQDYRAADVIQAARTQPTRARYGPEATPRSCGSTCGAARPSTWPTPFPRVTG